MIKDLNKKDISKLKVAIVHNWLWKMRGAERVLECMCELFPQANIYALFGDVSKSSKISKSILEHKINFSFLNSLPFISKYYRQTIPLWPIATEVWDFSDYDLVISSTASTVGGVITSTDTLHICYSYSPMRYIWDQRYIYSNKQKGLTKLIFNFSSHFLRIWDNISAKRPDANIAISNFISNRINKYYRIQTDAVIYPPVDFDRIDKSILQNSYNKKNYVIAVSPFEENKGVHNILDFAIYSGVKTILIGDGKLKNKLEKKYKRFNNIKFVGWVSDDELFNLVSQATALLFLGIEDFGLVPIEATYLGTPVIAYNKGGAKETIVDGLNGILVNDLSPESVLNAYNDLKITKWDRVVMREYANRFSKEIFEQRLIDFIIRKLDLVSK